MRFEVISMPTRHPSVSATVLVCLLLPILAMDSSERYPRSSLAHSLWVSARTARTSG